MAGMPECPPARTPRPRLAPARAGSRRCSIPSRSCRCIASAPARSTSGCNRAWWRAKRALSRLAALLRAYFRMGGLQAQLSLADTATLRDAREQPEAHRDLVVRITGYSALFTDMTRGAQEEIIRREEHAA